jgi:predicted nucleic acid-binding protein
MLFLADTSIWIDHFRKTDVTLGDLLGQRNILLHPFVLGEIALGHVPNLDRMIGDFRDLPRAPVAHGEEVLQLILHNKLHGSGIGYVDAHLLATCRLVGNTSIWTRDKRLLAAARSLSLAADL